jgi:chromosome segregation ATPase
MVMSLSDQIEALEEGLINVKANYKSKVDDLQVDKKKIKAVDKDAAAKKETLDEEIEKIQKEGSEKINKMQNQIDQLKEQNKDTDDEKANKEKDVIIHASKRPSIPPYRKTTIEEVKKAEKDGLLCGFDAVAMTASIRKK